MIYAYLLLKAVEVESAKGAPILFLSEVRGNLFGFIIWHYWMVMLKSELVGLSLQQQMGQPS